MPAADKDRPLAITTDAVAAWEDGLRQVPGDGRSELWHFDASLDTGMTLAIGFCLVGADESDPDLYETVVNVMVTSADGHHKTHAVAGTVRAENVGTSRCILPFGANTVDGDLRTYDVHVEIGDGAVLLDLRYEAQTDAYRPRVASPITLGDDNKLHFADLIVARCTVTGTVTLHGEIAEVAGEGAHDHQWFDSNPMTTWHHWLWGHLYTENYSVVVFDLVASQELGLERIPVFGVFDAAGQLVFDNEGPVQITTELAVEPSSGKQYPQVSSYRFVDGARSFTLRLEQTATLVAADMYADADASDDALGGAQQGQFDDMGIQPSYGRFRADASLTITNQDGIVHESGEMIYEFNYPAKPDPAALSSR